MLRHRSLLGEMTLGGEPYRADDGSIIIRAERLLSRQQWDRLQSTLNRSAIVNARVRSTGANLLTRVAYCLCGAPRHYRRQTVKWKRADGSTEEKVVNYLGCRDYWRYKRGNPKRCEHMMLNADEVEAYASRAFVALFGNSEVLRPVVLPAEDHTDALRVAEEELSYLIDQAVGAGTGSRKVWEERITLKQREVDRLAELPVTAATTVYESTGQTYGDAWNSSTDPERRQLLLDGGFKVYAAPLSDTFTTVTLAEAISRHLTGPDRPMVHAFRDAPFGLFLTYPRDIGERLGIEGDILSGWQRLEGADG